MVDYILDGHTPVLVDNMWTWAEWFEYADRQVALDTIGPYKVSTVFLGTDYRFVGEGPPILFETMAFAIDGTPVLRLLASTWDQAEECHAEILGMVERRLREEEEAAAAEGEAPC